MSSLFFFFLPLLSANTVAIERIFKGIKGSTYEFEWKKSEKLVKVFKFLNT